MGVLKFFHDLFLVIWLAIADSRFVAFLNTHLFVIALFAPWISMTSNGQDLDFSLWTVDPDYFQVDGAKEKWRTIRAMVMLSWFSSVVLYIAASWQTNALQTKASFGLSKIDQYISNNNPALQSKAFVMVTFVASLLIVIFGMTGYITYRANAEDFAGANASYDLFAPIIFLIGFIINFFLAVYLGAKLLF